MLREAPAWFKRVWFKRSGFKRLDSAPAPGMMRRDSPAQIRPPRSARKETS
jgi:hypothetical protein